MDGRRIGFRCGLFQLCRAAGCRLHLGHPGWLSHVSTTLLIISSSAPIVRQEWLAKTIHQRGSLDASGDALMTAVTGSPLKPSVYLDHLKTKYSKLYKLK
jgi:hypothetical protein